MNNQPQVFIYSKRSDFLEWSLDKVKQEYSVNEYDPTKEINDNDQFFKQVSVIVFDITGEENEWVSQQIDYFKSSSDARVLLVQDKHEQRPVTEWVSFLKSGAFEVIQAPTFEADFLWSIGKAIHDYRLTPSSGLETVIPTETTVLLVEDEPVLLTSYSRFLAKEGFSILKSKNAQEAYSNLANHQPDVVLLDLGLPDESGLSVLKHIKLNHPEIYVIVITAYQDIDLISDCIKAGAQDYWVKEFDVSLLPAKVTKAISLSKVKQAA